MKRLSARLIAASSETHSFALSRTDCIWSRATQTLNFIGRMEVSAAVKHKELPCQNIVSSRKRPEQIPMWHFVHYLLDLIFVTSYLLYEQNKLVQNSILQSDFGSDDSLGNMGYRFLHNTVESANLLLFSEPGLSPFSWSAQHHYKTNRQSWNYYEAGRTDQRLLPSSRETER